MNIYNDDILSLLLFALALGAFAGVVYDILHSLVFVASESQKAKAKKLFCVLEYTSLFLADVIFCIISGAGALILMFNLNKGVFRCAVYILMGLGFLFYRVTISRVVRKLLFYIIRVFGWINGIIYRIISIPLRVIFKIYHLTIGKIVCIIIGGIRNKREAGRQRKRELALVALCDSGKDEYVTPKENSEDTRKKRIFIGRKNA